MTAQLRKQQEEQRRQELLSKYPTTLLRIQFPDTFVLQMPLPAETLLSQVKSQILAYLEDSTNLQDIVLFTTPPKQILESDQNSLLELGLSVFIYLLYILCEFYVNYFINFIQPSSMVYISGRVLKEEYRLNTSSYLGAVREASRRLLITGSSSSSHQEAADDVNMKEETRPKRQAQSVSDSANNKPSNVPKWLKLKR